MAKAKKSQVDEGSWEEGLLLIALLLNKIVILVHDIINCNFILKIGHDLNTANDKSARKLEKQSEKFYIGSQIEIIPGSTKDA